MGGKNHTASYNSQNQLTKYDDLWYTYDADGNRVSAGDVKFTYDDNGHLLSDGANTYVYGASGVVGYYNKDGKFVTYLFNQRGDVVKETDESGSVINSFDYNDYGKLIGSDKAADSVFGYGGQYGAVTDKNGLIYLKTRYYNPEIMRFMNRDTVRGSITDTKSLNRFAYVEGNPLTYVDPNGEAATWLKNNPLDALYTGLMGLSFVPGLNIVASIGMMTIDLAKGDYTSLAMDSLGILIPGVGVGLKLSYDGVRAIVDGLRVTNEVRDVVKVETNLERTVEVSKEIKSSVEVSAKTASQETKYEVAIADQVNDRKILEDAEVKVDAEKNSADFYVKPNGDVVPATGYRYMSSKYRDVTKKTMTVPANDNGTYVGFEKFSKSSDVQNSFQISPEWSDAKLRGEFDTLQVIDDLDIPTSMGNTTDILEPITSAYPEYGSGGVAQVITKSKIHLRNVEDLK